MFINAYKALIDMNTNLKFRLGLLDGIQARQQGSRIDTDKLARVKGPDYTRGYMAGITTNQDINKTSEKGNRK